VLIHAAASGVGLLLTQWCKHYGATVLGTVGNEAKGQTARFTQVLKQYTLAPDVTRERLYLETMERVFGGMNKVIVDQSSSAQGVVPYLPLGALDAPQASGAARPSSQQGGAR
jgi:membrane protease subunit HflK